MVFTLPRLLSALLPALLFALAPPAVHAEDLKLALSAAPVQLDPHFYNHTPSINVDDHMFEGLTGMDANHKIVPRLADSWSMVNSLTWEFKLHKGVKFHDGTPMTAEDVIWSLDRPATIVNSPSKFDIYTKAIILKKIIDPWTVRLTTREPYPLMLQDLASVMIVSKAATQGLASEDFASGKGMAGTGPYKFVRYVRDDHIELARNDAYWGKTPGQWNKITLRFIPNGSTRLAALLAGDVQGIDNVPTPDLARVRADPGLTMLSKSSSRLIYLYVDTVRPVSPFVTDKDGKPLAKNPLQDPRVRAAISMAINREAIRDRVMEGLSEPTNNLVNASFGGFNPALKVVRYDPDGARKLLAAAGYPQGFGLTIHTPNNRYVNDEKITQTVAQMLSRVGIVTKVEGLPFALYSSRGLKAEYSAGLLGWAAQSGEASHPLRALASCPDPAKGLGTFNWLGYCNPKLTTMLAQAMTTLDEQPRNGLLAQAGALVVNDGGVIPLHQQVTTWAMKKGISYVPRTDEKTHGYEFSTAPPAVAAR
jgi:peptide/nickel transport system substrate-binding protein